VALNFLLQSGIEHYSVSKCRWELLFCVLILGTVAGHMMTLFCNSAVESNPLNMPTDSPSIGGDSLSCEKKFIKIIW